MAKRAARPKQQRSEIRKPEQARSRDTMETLLDVGRRLIEEKGIDDFSISDVAEAAGSSIGSLYFRFGSRDRFVEEVMQRLINRYGDDFARLMAQLNASAKGPEDVIIGVVGWTVRAFARNQGLLRAQLRRTLERPQAWRPFQNFARHIVGETVRSLETFFQNRGDDEWQLRVQIAMQIVFGTLNNILINRPGPLEIDDPRTAGELGKAAIRYLGLDEKNVPKRRSTS
jgi:AcrR family transcriptional regulator